MGGFLLLNLAGTVSMHGNADARSRKLGLPHDVALILDDVIDFGG
jgi:hypothetical protein